MNTSGNTLVIALLALLLLSPQTVVARNGSVIWKADNNTYIKYAALDTAPNDHPVVLDKQQLSTALASLRFMAEEGQQPEAVFSARQAALLGQHLATGLQQASRNQDIIFALQKTKRRRLGLGTDTYFVAGRAFYQNNALNIIIGDYNRPRNTSYEAAYDPTKVGIVRYRFNHGSRNKGGRNTLPTVAKTGGVQSGPRSNWLVIDVEAVVQAQAEQETARKQQQLATRREEIKTILAEEKLIPEPQTAPAPAEDTLEQRFTTLKNLRDKGLISDKEYAKKRQQLLDEI